MVSNTREDEDMLVDLLRHFVSTCLYTSVATVSRGLGTPNYTHVHTVIIGSISRNQEMTLVSRAAGQPDFPSRDPTRKIETSHARAFLCSSENKSPSGRV